MSAADHNEGFGANSWLIDEMRDAYLADPSSVTEAWQQFFAAEAGDLPKPTEPAPRPAEPAPDTPPAAAKPVPAATKPAATSPQPAAAAPPTDAATAPVVPQVNLPTDTKSPAAVAAPVLTKLRGAALRTAQNMDASLSVPTATSVRSVPMKLVIDQRTLINRFLATATGGKVSFTHLIAYAMVQALKAVPAMNNGYDIVNGKPTGIQNASINLGIAIDLPKPDGSRQLLVPNIKGCENMDFAEFWSAYETLVARARNGELAVTDFAHTTATITNPGGIGTTHSIPRLMTGIGLILGVGAINYPAEFQGMSKAGLTQLAVSKVSTFTSTYDHRVIQGAESGEFLKVMHELLLGSDNFYERIFEALRIPYAPLRWSADISAHRANQVSKTARVLDLVMAYRSLGHIIANTNPLEYEQRSHPDLLLETHGLTIWDLDREFAVGVFGTQSRAYLPLREILEILRDSYCNTVGVEYMHIDDPEQRSWFQARVEVPHTPLTHEEHMHALDKLNEAEVFETFLQTKFVGQKRFSLEGAESLLVLLDEVCQEAADASLSEVCIGMPHRGRLNVLANIVGKKYSQIFQEFDGSLVSQAGTGDVKYHLGSEGTFVAHSGATVKTSVAANPSHLEAVNPVLEGIARAKIDILKQGPASVLPILLHGDASFSGQGVVFETLQMSQLDGYHTGGTIHIVINNQIGFTTAPSSSRSSRYPTDVAKAISAPVLHVNGDDPDSCIRAARLAVAYRQRFHRDIVIDLVAYRRRGHNEGDDPSFTQPRMYHLIEQKRSVRRIYTESLIGRGDISIADAEEVINRFRERLETVFAEMRETATVDDSYSRVPSYPTKSEGLASQISRETIEHIAAAHTQPPAELVAHPKVLAQLERRATEMRNGPVSWATAETLALGTLLLDGRPVRLAGQDSRRGTFSQRFAAVVDRNSANPWFPLASLAEEQADLYVYDSLLSEYAAMGFEYGYSVARPDALVLWEAQFGDFSNGAQTIIDEFITTGFGKWGQNSGVVLLLPHGYEGQGPNHSSARLERYLQVSAADNVGVCQPSTAANYFHLLRHHSYVNYHRPLIIATPKSMLRAKAATSPVTDFIEGHWQPVLDDPSIENPAEVKLVLLVSGKLRWELVAAREELNLTGEVAIVALERLYPLPTDELGQVLQRYPTATVRFVQDEPANQGAAPFVMQHLPTEWARQFQTPLALSLIARDESAAPSVGSHKVHVAQAEALLRAAFAGAFE